MKDESSGDSRHVILTLLSTFLNTGAGLLLNFMMIRFMVPSEYGKFSSVMALLLINQEFVGRGINDSLIRLGTEKVTGSRLYSNYIFLSGLIAKAGIFFLFCSGYLLFAPALLRLSGHPEIVEGTWAIMAGVAGYGVWTLLLTRRQAQLDFTRLAFEKPLCNVIRLFLFGLVLYAGMLQWQWMIWIYAISLFMAAVLAGGREFSRLLTLPLKIRRIKVILQQIWRIASWNTLASLAFVAFSRIDILALTVLDKAEGVAVYNASWQMLAVIDLCTISIMTAMIPKVCHQRSREALKNWIRRCLKISIAIGVICVVFIVAASYLIPLLFNPVYERSVPLLFIMLPGYLITLLIFPLLGIIYARNGFRMLAIINMVFIPVAVAVYWPAHILGGVKGIAFGTMLLKTLMAAVLAFFIYRILPEPTDTTTAPA